MPFVDHSVDREQEDEPDVIQKMIGSAAFKGAITVLGIVFLFLLTFGWNAYLKGAASQNPDVVATKADVDTLKVAVAVMKKDVDTHTVELSQVQKDTVHAADIQGKIFDAIKGVSTDVHTIDVHLAGVAQQVTDQGEQLKELRASQK